MARTSRMTARRLPDSVRKRIEIATAMALESLVDTHVAQATRLVHLLGERLPLEDSLSRYLLEMDLGDSMASAVRTRVLVALEGEDVVLDGEEEENESDGDDDDDDGWRRFRPDVVMRGVRERQRRQDQIELWIQLALARAEENLITTHVDNAITFAALLEDYVDLERGVQHYLGAVALSGGRAQAVLQRTMARLADVHLPQAGSTRR